MNILVDRITNKVTGINTPVTPLSYLITVPEGFSISKVIKVQDGEVQKKDSEGKDLYLKPKFKTIYEKVGEDETIENTGVPYLEKIQKTNYKGEPLYLEPILDDKGVIVDYEETTQAISDDGQFDLAPVIIEVQKQSIRGNLIFIKDVLEAKEVEDGEEETTEITDKPVMVPNMVDKYVLLSENPTEFSVEEVVQSKYINILTTSGDEFIIADEFITEEDIDHTKPILANTGVKLLQLLPQGEITFKSIMLEAPTNTMYLSLEGNAKMLVNDIEAVDNVFSFTTAISSVVIKFVNPTDKSVYVSAYSLTYNKEVVA